MTYEDFSNKLKKLQLSRDEFSKIVGMSYNSVTNWKLKEIPAWVEPFLYYYEKSLALDELLKILEKYKKIDN
ncbi:hypothetical protein CW576_09420 [Campylobacter jejuni]|uniref:hypothetical protein n=1 Tax=Campylobacter jejuni TaxID=197 RepID=UPI00130621D4|nr:hypothetical protein [Campylobacter jejuni]EAI4847394.1 hypothetical protein [Campylobacter jejuni]EAI6347196.1 hypothetical protein [Campylobacter jejuni]EAI8596393.1 hypothetical protein [Campylobacter jejuni]EAI8631835.1 hypothetical protein [Campylobacter jejuni]ECK7543771.1 hypothetical protein [Campylobacter jejuni]